MSNHENQGTGYDSGAVGHETVGRADRPEPLSTGFERVYAEIHGEPVAAKRVETGPVRLGDDWAGLFLRGDNALFMAHAVARAADALRATDPLTAVMVDGLVTDMRSCQEPCEARPLYAHPDPAVERLQRELDEARGIVRNIYWMACRYADGRNTYAPGMYNRAIAKAYDAGWLTFDHTGRRYEVQYARDGMSPEWKTAEERALAAEASLAKAIAERDEARELITSFVLNEIDYMTRNKLGDAEQQHNVKWARRIGITATPARAILGDAP